MAGDKLIIDPNKRIKNACISNNASSVALMAKLHDQELGLDSNLRNNASEESIGIRIKSNVKSPNFVSRSEWITLAILTFVNLINYMDRYTIAGVLTKVQETYGISNSQAGLLQTAFVASFMIFAPLFGYLGDRFNRNYVMIVGITIWAVATLMGSFMEDFYTFMIMRAIVGIGEASYTTIAPTIISDLFVKDIRSKALAIFYFAIPVGSGLGYVVGQALTDAFGSWPWALRGTPILGAIAVLLLMFFLEEPKRGESEGHDQLKATSYTEDLKSLASNQSFIFSTLGFTCVTFCTGALSWWGPKFLEDAIKAANYAPEDNPMNPKNIPFVFGVVTMLSGIIGVPFGSLWSTKWRPKNQRADPLICGIGLALSSIFLCISLFTCNQYFVLAFVLIFLGEISLNLNWSIVADILLYVVVPTRRGTAEALQILFSHLFGDAGSPYLIGMVSDSLKQNSITNELVCSEVQAEDFEILNGSNSTVLCDDIRDFYSMQYSLVVNILIVFLGAVCFFITAVFIIKDKEQVERYVAESADRYKEEKEDMIIKSENNSTWSSEDDAPPQIIVNAQQHSKLEPLLEPLKFKTTSKA